MSQKNYAAYQKMTEALALFLDGHEKIDTVFGNELLQRMSDAAFEVYEKYDTDPNPAAEMKAVG